VIGVCWQTVDCRRRAARGLRVASAFLRYEAEKERAAAEERHRAATVRDWYIRALHRRGVSLRDIADDAGLSHNAIAKIVKSA
jgi:AraC-like DNA-binding protein